MKLLESNLVNRVLTGLAIAAFTLSELQGSRALAATIPWSNAAAGPWLTGTNWTGGATPGSGDVAQFALAPNVNATIGIDFAGATNNGAANQIVGAIEIDAARTKTTTINNSSTTPGILTLAGATVTTAVGGGPTANVIVHQNGGTGGTLSLNNGAGTGTMGIYLPNPTNVIAFDANFSVAVNSAISGPGGLTVMRNAGVGASNSPRVDLRSVNTYQGDTNIQSGIIRARVSANVLPHGVGTGNFNIASDGTLALDFDNTINGLNDLGGGGGSVLTFDAGPFNLTVGDNDANGAFSGVISAGLGLVKIGGGMQTLGGANTYTGTTAVNAGTLIVGVSHMGGAGYTVAGGATLGGGGTISAAVDLSGTLAPGTSPGTLTIGGLTLQNGSSGVFELLNTPGVHAPGAGNDLIDIAGTLTGLTATSVTIDVDAIGGGDLSSAGNWTLALYDSLAGTGIPTFAVTGVNPGFSYAVNVVPDDIGAPTGAGSIQLTLAAVPEPGNLMLLALGLAFGIPNWCRHRRSMD